MRADRSRQPDVGPDPPFRLPTAVRHALSNDLRVRTVEHHSAPVVTFVVQIDGGSSADPSTREGLAALTADMIDEGTGTLTALDVSDAIARIGGEYDVEVGADATSIGLNTLARFANQGAALLADLVGLPSLGASDFDRVRQMRMDRLRQLKDMPAAVAERTLLRLLYGPHPYGHLAIGSESALRGMTVEDVSRFHGGGFRPDRATVIAVGAFTHARLVEMVQDAFGTWAGNGRGDATRVTPASEVDPGDPGAPRLALVHREGAQQSELRISQLSARRNTPDYSALLVMNAILGGQFVSRVNLKLREEKGYTYGARTGFDWRRGRAPFTLQAGVHTAATADAIRDSLNELEGIRGARPVTEEELTLAKASLTRGYPRNFETAEQVARAVAQLVLHDLPDSYFEEFVPRVNAVTADDMTRAAVRHLDPTRLTTLVVGDRTAVEMSLGGLGLGETVVLPVDA
jgi:predicted Zn-dependent peptidase